MCISAYGGVQAMRHNPYNAIAAHGLAQILQNHRKDPKMADKYFQRSVEGHPKVLVGLGPRYCVRVQVPRYS